MGPVFQNIPEAVDSEVQLSKQTLLGIERCQAAGCDKLLAPTVLPEEKNLAPHVAMLSLWDLCLTMRSPYRTHKPQDPQVCPNSWPPVSSNTRWSSWSGVHRCTFPGSWPVQQRSLVTPRCKSHVFRPTECAAKGIASPGSFDTAQQIGLSRGIGVSYIIYYII